MMCGVKIDFIGLFIIFVAFLGISPWVCTSVVIMLWYVHSVIWFNGMYLVILETYKEHEIKMYTLCTFIGHMMACLGLSC